MKNYLLLLLAVFFSFNASAQVDDCDGYIVMYDSYGDGWNGNELIINGESFTLPSSGWSITPEGTQDTICVDLLPANEVSWIDGQYVGETSYEIYDADGNLLFGADGGNDNLVGFPGAFVEVLGCTNADATNFYELANTDDGSCLFSQEYVDNNTGGGVDCSTEQAMINALVLENTNLTTANQDLNTTVNGLEGDLLILQGDYDFLETSADELFLAYGELQAEIADTVAYYEAELANFDNCFGQDTLDALANEITYMYTLLDQANNNWVAASDYADELQIIIDGLNSDISALNQQLTSLSFINGELITANGILNTEVETLTAEVVFLTDANSTLDIANQDLTAEVILLQGQLTDCNNAVETLEMDLTDCEYDVDVLTNQLNDCLESNATDIPDHINDGFGCIDCDGVEYVKTVNTLGQEVPFETTGSIIYHVYSNGTAVKVYRK